MKRNKDFEDFRKYFGEYQQRFGLTGYKVYFKHESLEGRFADITVNQHGGVATIRLDKDTKDDIRGHAKHEALHLMLYRLEDRALDRYIRDGEIYEATEELAVKLEELIPD